MRVIEAPLAYWNRKFEKEDIQNKQIFNDETTLRNRLVRRVPFHSWNLKRLSLCAVYHPLPITPCLRIKRQLDQKCLSIDKRFFLWR